VKVAGVYARRPEPVEKAPPDQPVVQNQAQNAKNEALSARTGTTKENEGVFQQAPRFSETRFPALGILISYPTQKRE
jgi:hypothetical protein